MKIDLAKFYISDGIHLRSRNDRLKNKFDKFGASRTRPNKYSKNGEFHSNNYGRNNNYKRSKLNKNDFKG